MSQRVIRYRAPAVVATYYSFGDTSVSSPANQIFSGTLGGAFSAVSPSGIGSTDNANAGVCKLGSTVYFTGSSNGDSLYYATDPASWSTKTLARTNVRALRSNGVDKLVTVKNSGTTNTVADYSSDGGDTWATATLTGIISGLGGDGLAYGSDGYFGVVGYNSSGAPTAGKAAFGHESDLSTWTVVTIDSVDNTAFCSICHTGTHWVAGRGNGEVWRSADRSTWTKVSAAGDIFDGTYRPQYSTSDGAGKVLIGGWDGVFGHTPTFGLSTDHGATWTDVSLTFLGGKLANHIGYADGYFYTGGHRTADGTWETAALASGTGFDVSAGRFDGLVTL